jgi:hypothetical protein
MASKVPNPQPDPNYLSPEECRRRFGSFLAADPADVDIPDWHMEILKERIARYCEVGMHFTPWEEFEQELFEIIRKG